MEVRLLPGLEKFVNASVSAGQYASSSDVVNTALVLLRSQERRLTAVLERLRRQVAVGLRELERGEMAEWDPKEIKAAGRQLRAGKRKRDGRARPGQRS